MGSLKRGLAAFALQGALSGAAALAGITVGGGPWVPAALLAAVGMIAVVAEVVAQRGDDPTPRSPYDRRLAELTSAALALALLGGVLELGARGPASMTAVVGGCAMVVAGGLLRARAIAVLGEAFVTEARAPAIGLITRDVFAVVRHPSETGLLAIVAGAAIASPGICSALALAGALVCSMLRVRHEERTLATAFGDAHARYRATVGGIVPRV